MVSLLVDELDWDTQKSFIEYILSNKTGIYYIYDKRIVDLPILDNIKVINRYLSAIVLLIKYPYAKENLISLMIGVEKIFLH